MNIESTFSFDAEITRKLDTAAARAGITKPEALRRAITLYDYLQTVRYITITKLDGNMVNLEIQ